ncbi:MAG: alpha-2-macroglobulin family protein [Planctomycetota bacterium]|jgi:hypothetical protein
MDCEKVRERIYDLLYDVLEGEDLAAVQAHLDQCEACRARLESARKNLDHFDAWEAPKASLDLVQKAVANARTGGKGGPARIRKVFRWSLAGGGIAAGIFILFLGGLALYIQTLSPNPQELVFMGADSLIPGTQSSARVYLRNHDTSAPIRNAHVQVKLVSTQETETYALSWNLVTDGRGVADIDFLVPDWPDGSYRFEINAATDVGTDFLTHNLNIWRPLKVLLTTAKPLYQPGQTFRIRTLGLFASSQKPVAGKQVLVEVRNPQGIKVFKKSLTASRFGIASCDMPLATELDLGPYEITAKTMGVESKKTVTVKKYVLPKFKLDCRIERGFFLPGEKVKGEVHAAYLFGKPVSRCRVRIQGIGDWERLQTEGTADDEGIFSFTLPLPDSWAGIPLEKGKGLLEIEIQATDTAGHEEKIRAEIVITSEPYDLYIFPAGGRIARGLENRFFLYLARPDGSPCSADVVLESPSTGQIPLTVDDSGIASFEARVTGDLFPLTCEVRVPGAIPYVKRWENFGGDEQFVPFLLIPEKSVYTVGDSALFRILTPREGKETLFLDVVKDRQTVMMRVLEVKDGSGKTAIDLDASLRGLLTIHLYRLNLRGEMERDTRLIFVRDDRDLRIGIEMDRKVYKPGEKAMAVITLTGEDGTPSPGALSLCAVDEAVFALQEMRPGFLETYFQIEETIRDPRAQVKSAPEIPAEEMTEGGLSRASVAVASRRKPIHGYSILPNSFREKAAAVRHEVRRCRDLLYGLIALGILFLILLLLLGLPPAGLVMIIFRSKFAYIPLLMWLAVWLVLFVLMVIFLASCGVSGDSGWAPRAKKSKAMAGPKIPQGPSTGGEAPRVRRDFPETLLWKPELVTDDAGRLELTIPLADSITTWRLTAQAVTEAGSFGSREVPIRVFQDFFVDLDLPRTLTRKDEIEIPAVIYNYLEKEEEVRLRVETDGGVDLLGLAEWTLTLGPGEVRSVPFRVRAEKVGVWTLRLFGIGRGMSDALEREIEVVPDGRAVVTAFSDFLGEEGTAHDIEIPEQTIPGSETLLLKVYPGPLATAVEGLEKIVRMPFG